MSGDDCWGAFGSDDDDSDGEIVDDIAVAAGEISKSSLAGASEVTHFLAKSFLHTNSQIPIGLRRIALAQEEGENHKILEETLTQRGFTNLSNLGALSEGAWLDAVILVCGEETKSVPTDKIYKTLVPGGILLVFSAQQGPEQILTRLKEDRTAWEWDPSTSECVGERIFSDDNLKVLSLKKPLCQVQDKSCLWLPSAHSLPKERCRLGEATVPLSAHEIQSSHLLEPTLVKAVQRMQDHGYCILPRLLHPEECREWGQGVLSDLHTASKILLERDGVNILNPHSSEKDPQSYRELSMREDLRMDLRDGPRLRKLRGDNNDKPVVVKAANNHTNGANPFLRLHRSILEVVRRTMNPKSGTLYKGNFGRHNFNGSGPDGSYQDMRLSAIGGIVSLPGSADQALHADTPHLFEHATLPAHYINAFALGCEGNPKVGCTSFVHGSHKIEFTAEYLADDDHGKNKKVFEFLVRPQLELGDVILFDCRTLHFGLANTSKQVERPLLYCNITHAWFYDPKNWNNRRPIFEDCPD